VTLIASIAPARQGDTSDDEVNIQRDGVGRGVRLHARHCFVAPHSKREKSGAAGRDNLLAVSSGFYEALRNFSGMHHNISLRIPSCGIGLLAVLAWVAGCSPAEKLEPAIPPVQTIVLSTATETPFRRFPGEVAAADTSEMSFDVPGRLIEFPATQGMVFKFGELLGRLDETNFVARVDSARADFNTAHNELARRRQLHQRGVISRSELDGFQRANDVAEAALREAQRALDDTRMLAPFDGRVARTLVNNFQNVQARQPVLVFQSTSTLEVDIQVPESDMSVAQRGITARNARDLLEARAEFPTIPNKQFDLELKSFSTEATPSARTFRVTFNLYPPEDQNILPGMTCTVLLRAVSRLTPQSAEEGVFQVPVRAVSTAEGKSAVWKLNPSSMKVSRVPVEMLGVSGDFINVRGAALSPNDEIITSGVRFLSEGMKVRRMQANNP
jgi:RND family efflux transporter MFP subunit